MIKHRVAVLTLPVEQRPMIGNGQEYLPQVLLRAAGVLKVFQYYRAKASLLTQCQDDKMLLLILSSCHLI